MLGWQKQRQLGKSIPQLKTSWKVHWKGWYINLPRLEVYFIGLLNHAIQGTWVSDKSLLSIPAKDIANSSVIASTLSTQNEELRNAWTMSRSVRGDCYSTSRKINPWHHGLNPHQKRTISVAILHFKELNSYSHFFVPLPLQDVKPPLPALFSKRLWCSTARFRWVPPRAAQRTPADFGWSSPRWVPPHT